MAKRRAHHEGSISRRSDGRYQGCLDLGYVDGKRQRKYYYGDTQASVQRQLLEARFGQSKGVPVIAGKSPTLKEFGDLWLSTIVKISAKPRTHAGYSGNFRLHIEPALGRIRLNKLESGRVQQLLASLSAGGLSPATINLILKTLRSMLSNAVKQNLIALNPASSSFITAPRVVRREVTALTPEAARKFLDHCQGERFECAYVLAIVLGMRKGEVVGLRWQDVDLDARSMRVNQILQRVYVGSEPGHKTAVLASTPKTASSRRQLMLPEFVVKLLRSHKAHQSAQRLAAGERWMDKTGLVFTDKHGHPIEALSLWLDFKNLLKKAGLPPETRFHDLRHICASLLLAKNVHPKLVQKMLGHSSIAMTLDLYSHVMQESQTVVSDTMAQVFGR